MGNHVSLTFIYIHFEGNWDRSISPERVIYKSTTNGFSLRVVVEGPTGNKQTYSFRLGFNEEVWVSLHDNIVYVPGVPHSRQPGDATQILNTADASQNNHRGDT